MTVAPSDPYAPPPPVARRDVDPWQADVASTSADVLPGPSMPEAAIAAITAVYVALLGAAAGLIWAAVAPTSSIAAIAAGADAAFHPQIGADAWFLLVAAVGGALTAGAALVLMRDPGPGLAAGLAVGGTVAAIVADRVGYLVHRGDLTTALVKIGAHPTGSAISLIDFRVRSLGVLAAWPFAAVLVIGIAVTIRTARR
jgi:hypothetical protein